MAADTAADWSTFLLEGTATAVGAALTLVAVVVGARVYREGVKDRPVQPHQPTPPDPPDCPQPPQAPDQGK